MQILPSSLHIGVIRGGPSPEYDVSIKTGANVLRHLSETHIPIDIFISKDGKWHMNGLERSPERILKHVDVVFNALHGAYGEDGGVQEVLNHQGVPYVGSDRYASALSMNRWMSGEKARQSDIKTPVGMLVRRSDHLATKAKQIFESIPCPLVVKPAIGGFNVGFHKVQSFTELITALEDVLSTSDSAIVEEYISGKFANCGVIDKFRQQENYVLPPVEIISPEDINCPGNFSSSEKKEIERVALLIHNRLGLKHYSNSNFVVSPKRGVYLLEVNTTPKIEEKSSLSESLHSVGIEVKDFLHHLIDMAVHKTGLWV